MKDEIQANKVAVRRFLEEFLSCGDPAVADQVLAPDFVDHNPSNPELSGRENVKRSVRDWCAAFPDTRTVAVAGSGGRHQPGRPAPPDVTGG